MKMMVKLQLVGNPPQQEQIADNVLKNVAIWVCIPLVVMALILVLFTVSDEDEEYSDDKVVANTSDKAVANTSDNTTSGPKIPLLFNVHNVYQKIDNMKVQRLSSAMALPAALVLFNVDGNINIGMCIRSAAILGFSDVYIIGRNKRDRRGEVGSTKYVRVHKLPTIDMDFFDKLELLPILVEQGGTPLEDMKFNKFMPRTGQKVAFVVGAEDCGIPASFIAAAKERGFPFISISQYGVMRSLNVSIAASIVMYEYTKQWRSSVSAIYNF